MKAKPKANRQRVAIVTGASSGISLGIIRAPLELSHVVVCNNQKLKQLESRI